MKIKLISTSVCPIGSQCFMADSAIVEVSTPGGCNTNIVESPTVSRCIGPPAFEKEYTLFEGKNVDILGINLGVIDIENNKAGFKIVFGGINTNNKYPVITSVSGPTDLEVNEIAKWSIEAYDTDGKYLKYSVDWGENIIYPGSSASNREISQEATFTHKYSYPGKYTVVFTVTDEDGGKAQSSISVNVGSDYGKWEEFSLKKKETKTFKEQSLSVELREVFVMAVDYVDKPGKDVYSVEVKISSLWESCPECGVGPDPIVKTLRVGDEVEFFNKGKLKLLDIQTIKTIPVQYVAKFGIKFEKNPTTCSACVNGVPTGKYDENGCMIYDCPNVRGCSAVVPYCPNGELIKAGINEAGCTIWECVSDGELCNGHKVGERYLAEDGCNTCECMIDGSGKVRESCTEMACPPIEQKECPQLGYREKGNYCNINNIWEEQRKGGEYCDNDFECSSNSCLDSQCTEPGFWIKLSKWLTKFFGQS